MPWLAARRGARCAGVLWLTLAVALCGCSAIAPYMGGQTATPPPTAAPSATGDEPVTGAEATPGREPTAAPAAVPTTAEVPTGTPTPGEASTPATQVADTDALGLVYARGTSVLQTGYLGGEAREVAVVPPYDAWSFHEGRLALALGPAVEVIDLLDGSQVSLRVETDAEVEFAEVYWGMEEGTLLHVAWIADEAAPTHGRRVELRALSPADGRVIGQATLPDVAGVTVLRYSDLAGGSVALIPRGGDPAFGEVRVIELSSGETAAVHPVVGEGEAAMSPDLSQVVTGGTVEGGPGLWLHDLGGDARSRGWRCPEGTRPVSPAWSPDGDAVAFVLQPDPAEGPEDEGALGLWVMNAASPADTLDVRPVMAESGASSSLIGWTPDGEHVLGYHRGGGGDAGHSDAGHSDAGHSDAYVFAVRPDGGDRRILNLGGDAVVLGWMPAIDAGAASLAVDPWPVRFAEAQQDAAALAGVAAEYVVAHADRTDEELSAGLGERLTAAGWQLDLGGPGVRRVDEGLYVAQLPPLQICLLEGGRAQQVASGQVILDARRDGDVLGLIYGVIGASSMQPGFVLLGREDDGTWVPRWSPQGQRDWVATDGEIRFEGEGVDTLLVSGTSFGIDLGGADAAASAAADAFIECHACPHRHLSATWRRDGAGYVRQSALPADAALPEVIWEMTEPTPYAVVHEALRRARAGEDAGDLATAEALARLNELGLLAPEARLMPEEVHAEDGVVVFGGEGGARYRATVRDGRLVDVTTDNG